jgi:N-acetylmuramoyl-L-alanine amidase
VLQWLHQKEKKMAKKSGIVIHHSLSLWGNMKEIRRWHTDPKPKGNGWSDIGYHKVITNDYPTYNSFYKKEPVEGWDGKIVDGRKPETSKAAAVLEGSMNTKGIHICVVGNFDIEKPTEKQYATLVDACARLCERHGLTADAITYHRDWAINSATGKPYKSCPGTKFPSRATLRAAVKNAMMDQD